MRGVVSLVVPALVILLRAQGEEVGPGGDVAVPVHIGRVPRPHSVDHEAVKVEFAFERGGGVGPHAVCAFGHFHRLAVREHISLQLHGDRLRVSVSESYGMIRIDLRGSYGRAETQRLLCSGRRAKRQRESG